MQRSGIHIYAYRYANSFKHHLRLVNTDYAVGHQRRSGEHGFSNEPDGDAVQ
jgi:hypothetical protein